MRKDIYERMKLMKKEEIDPNFSEIGRRFNCDYRTAKKYYELDDKETIPKAVRPSKLDPYKDIIEDKVKLGCSAMSIYKFILKKGYDGKYSILKVYVRKLKELENKKATIRFETTPGLQAQVDWKETMKMISKNGEVFIINIFLIVLGYSRLKFFRLTLDKNQDTLFKCMIDSFKYYKGIPKEILFDNMKTVIDQSRTSYQNVIINESFYQFSKDMGFEVISCRAYRPQTKGKAEALAKLMDRLKPYNYEFETIEELERIVIELNEEINNEVSQATNEIPYIRFQKEKEYLSKLPNLDLLDNYLTRPIERKVSKESMVTYLNNKYSLHPKYIGKTVTLIVKEDKLDIIYKQEIIASHKISDKHFNYHKDHMIEILKSDAFKFKSDDEIEKIADKNLEIYDSL